MVVRLQVDTWDLLTLGRVLLLYLYLSRGSAGVNVEERLEFELNCWADWLIVLGSMSCGWVWKGVAGSLHVRNKELPARKPCCYDCLSQVT